MNSIIGRPESTTEKNTKYLTYQYGCVGSGTDIEREVWNYFMNNFVAEVRENRTKVVVWRAFPSLITEEIDDGPFGPYKATKIYARYCFEEQDGE